MKRLESFVPVDCDEVHGESNVAAAEVDDFTVETSLEDLEFGFSIIRSTQKVRSLSQWTRRDQARRRASGGFLFQRVSS